MNRLSHLCRQLAPRQDSSSLRASCVFGYSAPAASDDDVVIVSGIRAAQCKAKCGLFKDTHCVQLPRRTAQDDDAAHDEPTGLQAIADIAASISAGYIDIGLSETASSSSAHPRTLGLKPFAICKTNQASRRGSSL